MLTYKNILVSVGANVWSVCMLVAGAANAQLNESLPVLRADTLAGQVLMLPGGEVGVGSAANVDGVHMSISEEGDFRVYRALHKGKEHKIYVAREGRPRWLAFDPAQGRFRDVLSSLRVELSDYDQLPEFVEAVGGIRGKAYIPLGFAIVELPSEVNPAEVASIVQSLPGVEAASIQLEGPIHVPM